MNKRVIKYRYHILAILIVSIWGATFVSTKKLISGGLTPATIFLYRFSIAYIGLVLLSIRQKNKLFAQSLKDEFLFVLCGFFGGSLYFITENSALRITQASNVAIIISAIPLLTAILSRIIFKIKQNSRYFVIGTIVAMVGVALAVFNGSVILDINPLGDALTLAAAFSWACYSILLKYMGGKYSSLFLTRKVFFYGLVTLVPFIPIVDIELSLAPLSSPNMMFHLLFLSVVASLICFVYWSIAVKQIGVIASSNYIYLSPAVSLLTSYLFLNERITVMALVGVALILFGVYISGKNR